MADTAHDTDPLRQAIADKDAVIGGVAHDEPGGQSLDQGADLERLAAMSGGQDEGDRLTRPARSMEGGATRSWPPPIAAWPARTPLWSRWSSGLRWAQALRSRRPGQVGQQGRTDNRTHVGDGLQQGRAGPWTPRLRLEPDLDPGPSWTTTRSCRRLSATASSRACLRRVFSLAASPLKHRAEKWAPVPQKRCENKSLEKVTRFLYRATCSS